MPQTIERPGYRLAGLGPVVLTGPREATVSLRTRKQFALLYYLARRGRPVSRDELIDLFWHDSAEKLARHSLSQCCSLINKGLGAEVITAAGRDRLAVVPGVVALDVVEFEELVARGAHEEALELWRGALFEGMWIQRAPRFERWLTEEREKLQRLYRRLAHARIEALRQEGDHHAIREDAERLLQHDALDEKAMLAWLESVTLLGDRALALRRFAEFEQKLRKELDAEPGGALRGWAKRARRSEDGGARPVIASPRISEITVLPSVQPFFGRTEEFGQLWRAWEMAGTGKGAFIIIEGEAGIGKTALATKLVNQAHVAGGSVCFVKCYRTEKSVPFAPVTALVRQLSRLPGFVAVDPVWIGELTRLVPELRERYPAAPHPMALDDAARHRVSDATVNAALSVADEQPLMIVIDDIQDSDESSLALLHYLGRQTPSQPVLLIGLARSGSALTEFEKTFFLTAQVAGFGRTLCISPLPEGDIRRLVEQVLAHRGLAADQQTMSGILVRSRGNPLAAVEATLAWERLESARHLKKTTPANPLSVEPHFGESALTRLNALSADARLVAQSIAVAGRPLSEYELGIITRLGPAELSAAVTSLEDAHFGRRQGPSVALAHERYAGIAEESLQHHKAREIHARLGHLLAQSAATNPAARYEAARHLLDGELLAEARDQASSAVRYADFVGAVRGKAEALELLRSVEPGLDTGQLHELCACYLHLNDLAKLRSLLETPPQDSGSRGRDFDYYEIAADYQSGLSNFAETAERLEAHLKGSRGTSRSWREACTLLIRIAEKLGQFERVRSIARMLRRERLSSHALFAAAYVRLKYYWPSQALELMRKAVEQARVEGELEIEQLCRDGIPIILKQIGSYRESISQFDLSLGLARKTMNPHAEVACLHNRAVSELCLGEWDRVQASHAEAERVGSEFAGWGLHLFRGYNTSLMRFYRNDWDAAFHGFESIYSEALRLGFATLAKEAKGGSALALMRLGQLSKMRDAVTEVRRLVTPNERMIGWTHHAAMALDEAINHQNETGAIEKLQRRIRELDRRDVSHGLALRLELVLLLKTLGASSLAAERDLLKRAARRVEAEWVVVLAGD